MKQETLLATLRQLEVALHRPEVRSNTAELDRLLHPRFREIGRSGRVWTRQEVLAELAGEPPSYEIWAGNFELERLADNLALLTYQSAHVAVEGGLERHTLRSSLWQLVEEQWRMIFHQGTPCETFNRPEAAASRRQSRAVHIEGLTPPELLNLPAEELDALIFIGRPVVVRVGSAEILAECHRRSDSLVVDLAHIEGGGEGALPTLTRFLARYAESRGFEQIEWVVRATNCARPNEKLRRVLVRKGFEIRVLSEFGECYYKVTGVGAGHVV